MDKNQSNMIVDCNLESVFWLPCLTVLFVHHLCCHLDNCSFLKFYLEPHRKTILDPWLFQHASSCRSFKPNLFHHNYDHLFLPRRPWRVQTQGEGGLSVQEVQNTALVVDLGTKVVTMIS